MKSIHILLVEDNEGDVVLIKEALEEGRIANDISVCRDGEKAIHYLTKEKEYKDALKPDLILLDINLPRKNGHEVLQFVKQTDGLKHIPVIMLTTSSSEIDITKSYKEHANCYITKPMEVNAFLNAMMQIEQFWFNLVKLPTEKENR
ncbi:response regulator [Rhodohalobacter sp.]|uniref:response regulator n=1 Tax=Rhodohalobacter sp. TaxID=1974210 RepID=UPI002ACD6ECD|nr:response regulator [Rhodohalobacter sp.]MDZ7755426.1 response regulator [Rhodohalobacter sp.]